jgi:dTDP-4-amino-4,6-dideoxygalactose transaminase|tara:strand:- start:1378 stop:1596 length:219 start_codon:yes stop_codon:yes gene_type:complete
LLSNSRGNSLPQLGKGKRRLQLGDKVITVDAGFPTTVNPIIQNGLAPVFVDVNLYTCDFEARFLANSCFKVI